ncbi:MAG: hypothetical protein RR518_06240 [Coprobacillus sp.]
MEIILEAKQSPESICYLKAFVNDDNYQDISFIMTQYSYHLGIRLQDSSERY